MMKSCYILSAGKKDSCRSLVRAEMEFGGICFLERLTIEPNKELTGSVSAAARGPGGPLAPLGRIDSVTWSQTLTGVTHRD